MDTTVKNAITPSLSQSLNIEDHSLISARDTLCALTCISARKAAGDYFACNSFILEDNMCHYGLVDITNAQNFTLNDQFDIYYDLDFDV